MLNSAVDDRDLQSHPRDARRRASHRFLLRGLLNSTLGNNRNKIHDSPRPSAPSQPHQAPTPLAPLPPLRFDQPGPLASSSQRWTCTWARILSPRLWTMGFAEQALTSLFHALPPAFCAILEAAAPRLEGVLLTAQARRAADSANEAAAARRMAVSAAARLADGDADSWPGLDMGAVLCQACEAGIGGASFLECLEDIWERDAEEGLVEFAFEPHTQQRANVMLSSRAAAIAGVGKGQLLAQLAVHDAPLPLLPLDFLCALVHRALLAAIPSGGGRADAMHVRMAPAPGRACAALVRVETSRDYDAAGRVVQVARMRASAAPRTTEQRMRPSRRVHADSIPFVL